MVRHPGRTIRRDKQVFEILTKRFVYGRSYDSLAEDYQPCAGDPHLPARGSGTKNGLSAGKQSIPRP